MLTEADKRIISRDGKLPGLAVLLDAEMLLEKLKELPRFKDAVKAEIQYLRYKPGNSCASTLYITLADGTGHHYYAKALTEKRFQESWNKPSRQKLIQKGGPFAPLAVADLFIMLFHPIHDKNIGHLEWLVSETHRKHMLKACSLPEIDDEELAIKILRYKPERRLVAKVSRNGQPVAIIRSGTPEEFTKMLIGNAFGMSHGGVLLMGADGASCTLATNWQKGDSLCPEEGRLPSEELVTELAKQLVRIHSATYQHPVKYGIQNEIQSLQGVFNTFEHILPEQAEWFAELSERVGQGLGSVSEQFALIHGDFSLDQVVRRKNKAGEIKLHILDWDRSAYGHPLMDLAAFQARLELQVIEGVLPRWQADAISETFFQVYAKRKETDLAGLYWFVASAMLRLAAEPFRKRDPEWEQYTLQLLQRAEEILADEGASFMKFSARTADTAQDALLETLLNPAKMQVMLHEAGILPEYDTVTGASLRRYKAARRALVDYQIPDKESSRYIIGKYRTKGLDKRSCRIQEQFWQSGFDEQAKTGVPEVLGALPELNTWFQRRINGQGIGAVLIPQNRRLAFLGRCAADAVNTLHQSGIAQTLELPCWRPSEEWQILHKRLTETREKLPQLAGRIAAVLEKSRAVAEKIPDMPSVTVHRDFYQDQIFEQYGRPGHMVLLDLDLVCRGHAALDAGNYIAHIQEFSLRRYGNIEALRTHEDAFRRHFLNQSKTAIPEAVEIYATLSLVRHIHISTLFENRTHTTETLLTICETRLDSHFD